MRLGLWGVASLHSYGCDAFYYYYYNKTWMATNRLVVELNSEEDIELETEMIGFGDAKDRILK